MTLQFDSGAYGQAFQQGQNNEQADRDRNLELIQMLGQGVQGYQQGQLKKQSSEQAQKLYELQLAKAQRDLKQEGELDTPYSQLLSSGQLSRPVAPQSLLESLQTPGMGEAGMPQGQQPGIKSGGLMERFRQFQQGKLAAPQMAPQEDVTSKLQAFGLPPEAASMTPRQVKMTGEAKKLFAQPGLGDYDQQKQDLDLQIRQERLNQMRGGQGGGGAQKAPAGYRYTVDGNLEAIPGGPAMQKALSMNEKLGSTYELYKTARDGLLTSLEGSSTGPIMGRIPAVTSAQQTAQGGVAAMAPVLKQLFRVAGEGVFTDRDQALLMQMIPTRETLPEARNAQIANIDAIVKAKLGIKDGDGMGTPSGQSNQPVIQRNKKTGQTRISYDGGQTWQIQ